MTTSVSTAAADPAPAASQIDASCRYPLLFFTVSSALWFFLGALLLLVSYVQLLAPTFLAECPGLTFGHVRPAAQTALLYGFASQAGMALMVWMLCRLGRVVLCCQTPMFIGWGLWNIGVTVGLLAILIQGPTGFEFLEIPRYAAGMLFFAYLLVGLTAMVAFHQRVERTLYVSQWYLLAALFWFPWIYSAANLLLFVFHVRGVVQAVVNAWFASNLLQLWLVPIGLASIFYFLPKLLQRPLHNRGLATFSFWTFAFFANWLGFAQLIGSPVPSWMVSAGVGANMLMLVPLLGVALNWHWTIGGQCQPIKANPVLKFTTLAAGFYLFASLVNFLTGFRGVASLTQWTHVRAGCQTLFLFGFFSLAVFAAFHYVLPRAVALKWPSQKLADLHLLATAAGAAIMGVSLIIAGLAQGAKLNDPMSPFASVTKSTQPWLFLTVLGLLVLLAGQAAFLKNLFTLVHQFATPHRKAVVGFLTGADAVKAGVPS